MINAWDMNKEKIIFCSVNWFYYPRTGYLFCCFFQYFWG